MANNATESFYIFSTRRTNQIIEKQKYKKVKVLDVIYGQINQSKICSTCLGGFLSGYIQYFNNLNTLFKRDILIDEGKLKQLFTDFSEKNIKEIIDNLNIQTINYISSLIEYSTFKFNFNWGQLTTFLELKMKSENNNSLDSTAQPLFEIFSVDMWNQIEFVKDEKTNLYNYKIPDYLSYYNNIKDTIDIKKDSLKEDTIKRGYEKLRNLDLNDLSAIYLYY